MRRARGRPAGFQQLQGRMQVKGERDIDMLDRQHPTAFLAFDLLRAGAEERARAELDRTQVAGKFPAEAVIYLALADAANGEADRAIEVLLPDAAVDPAFYGANGAGVRPVVKPAV